MNLHRWSKDDVVTITGKSVGCFQGREGLILSREWYNTPQIAGYRVQVGERILCLYDHECERKTSAAQES